MKLPINIIRTTFTGLVLGATAFTAQADSYEDGLIAYASGHYAESAQHLSIAAEQGSAGAEHLLMRLFTEGKLKTDNLDHETLKWTQRAAEKGIKQAQFALAEIYAKKHGNVKDALQWYQRAADQNHPDAIYALGEIYREGAKNVEADSQNSNRLYQIAASEYDVYAQKGHPEYQYALAEMYQHAKGVKKDMRLALKWMGKSAQQGHALAQLSLGRLYASGNDVDIDINQAKYWLNLAAAQGLRSAIAMLDNLKHNESDRLAYSM